MADMTSGSGCCWPEQEAVWAGMKRHSITMTFEQERELKDAVTAYRVSVQGELEQARQALTAPRVPDGWRSAAENAIRFVDSDMVTAYPITAAEHIKGLANLLLTATKETPND